MLLTRGQGTTSLCQDCHRQMIGFSSHPDARLPETVTLSPPFASGRTLVVPHREHIEEGNADCVDCHMHYSRQSMNDGDVRTHTLLPNEWAVDDNFQLPHFDETCGQCHEQATTCEWCHTDFSRSTVRRRANPQPRTDTPGKPAKANRDR